MIKLLLDKQILPPQKPDFCPKKLPLTIRVKLMAFDFCHKKQLFDKIMVSGTYYEIRPGLKLVEEKDFVTTFMVNNTSQ